MSHPPGAVPGTGVGPSAPGTATVAGGRPGPAPSSGSSVAGPGSSMATASASSASPAPPAGPVEPPPLPVGSRSVRSRRPAPTPARPWRYGLADRFGDWWHARADARAGLPSAEPGRPTGTATLEVLAQDFLAGAHRERQRLDEELAPLLEQAAQLTTRITETELAVARATAALAAWPVLLAEDQLRLRRAGETGTAADVVRARRAREYELQRRPLVNREADLYSQLTKLRVELTRLRSRVRATEVVGATRVRRLHAQVMRRISAYERHLVRRHPAGDRIGGVLAAQHPRVPGWVPAAEDAGGDPAVAP